MNDKKGLSIISPLGDFVRRESFGGILIVFSTVLGLLFANTMAIPALLFLLISDSQSKNGWGIAVATDIALALTVLTLVGKRAKESLRPFLLGLAVIDYTGAILKKLGIEFRLAYVLAGLALWLSLYKTGIHPWSSYFIVPFFAFSNGGIGISSSSIQGALNASLFKLNLSDTKAGARPKEVISN